VREICEEWRLEPVDANFPLSYGFVLAVQRQSGQAAVLKLRVPDQDFGYELAALETYGGEGMCAILERDRGRGAMLLERVEPGVPLVEMGEVPEAVSAAASLMRRLRKPPASGFAFESLPDWWRTAQSGLRQRAGGGTSPLPTDLVAAADEIYAEVASDSSQYVVLHGDLHHWKYTRTATAAGDRPTRAPPPMRGQGVHDIRTTAASRRAALAGGSISSRTAADRGRCRSPSRAMLRYVVTERRTAGSRSRCRPVARLSGHADSLPHGNAEDRWPLASCASLCSFAACFCQGVYPKQVTPTTLGEP
jgi:hypothetical protein